MGEVDKKLVLGEVLGFEIALYAFENKMIDEVNCANRRYEEAQRNLEEAQRNLEEARRNYEAILSSRIWRYTWFYRKTGSWVKSVLRNSAIGRVTLRILRTLVR